jgi:uncharacterized protein YbaP (TraB family)
VTPREAGQRVQEPSEAAPSEKQVEVAPPATATPLIWRLERDGITLTLFGSVHLARKDIFPLPAAILESFHQADELLVEVDLSAIDPAELQKITLNAITMPQGSSLMQILPPEIADQATRALEIYPIPPGFADSLEPWALEQILITMAAAEAGIGTEEGVDSYFLQQALITDKNIRQLETLEQQLGFFQYLPMDLHIASLQHTLSNLPDIPQQMEQLLNAWKRGDREQVETLIFEDWHEGDFDDLLNQVLLDDRNRDWVTQIETLATQEWTHGQEIFIVVGLGHLIGDAGLPTLLYEKGFR